MSVGILVVGKQLSIATPSSLAAEKMEWFYILQTGLSRLSWNTDRKTSVVSWVTVGPEMSPWENRWIFVDQVLSRCQTNTVKALNADVCRKLIAYCHIGRSFSRIVNLGYMLFSVTWYCVCRYRTFDQFWAAL